MYLYNSGPSETEHGTGPQRPVMKWDDGPKAHKEPEPEPAPAAEVEEQKPEEEKPAEEQPAEEQPAEEVAPPAKEKEGDNKPSERDPVSSGCFLSPHLF